MPWRLRFNEEHQVQIDDLPASTINKIAKKHGLSWLDLYSFPAQDLDALRDLIAYAAGDLGVEMPPSQSMGEMRELVNLIERVKEDRPETYDEGGLPLAEDQTTE